MKIVIITPNFPVSSAGAIVGGMKKNPYYLARTLKKKGCEVEIVTDSQDLERWEVEGMIVHGVPRGKMKGFLKSLALDFRMHRYFEKNIKDCDVVNVHHITALSFFLKRRKNRLPIVYTAHGTSWPEFIANFDRITLRNMLLLGHNIVQTFLDMLMMHFSDANVSPSEFQVEEMSKIYRLSPGEIKVIPNGVDTSFYFPNPEAGNALKSSLGLSGRRMVLFVGRPVPKKGSKHLLHGAPSVIGRFPDARFVFVFGGAKNSEAETAFVKDFKREVSRMNLDEFVQVHLDVPEIDLPAFYNAADVCVVPSQGYESIPTVVFEMLAAGKPVVAQNSWGIKEQIEEGLIEESEFSAEALADEICRFFADPKLCEAVGRTNRDRAVALFDSGKIAEMYLDVFRGAQDRKR